MFIKFKVNLGSRDASRYGLKLEDCMDGLQANVSDKHAEELIARGIAGPCESTANTVKAVPSPPEIQGKSDSKK